MFRLMTYNLGAEAQDKLSQILKFIHIQKPDILLLNELSWINKNSPVLNEISKKLDLPSFVFAKSNSNKNNLALFSKFRIKDKIVVEDLQNAGVISKIKTTFGDVSIAGVHLAPNTEDARLAEISKVIYYQKDEKYKIILGDLNSISIENQVRKINPLNLPEEPVRYDVTNYIRNTGYTDVALKTGKQSIPTVPITKDQSITYYDLRLDYIFLSKKLSKRLLDYEVIRNRVALSLSDHLPTVADIK